MVQIPQYAARQGLETPRAPELPGQVPVDNSVGQALDAVGGALGNLGQHIEARQQQKASFNAQIGYDTLQEKLNQDLLEYQRTAPADGSGIHDQFMQKSFGPKTEEFLGSITDKKLQEQFRTRIGSLDNEHWGNSAANKEYDQGNAHSQERIGVMWQKRAQAIAQDPAAVENYVSEMTAIIDSAPQLTTAQREEAKAKVRENAPAIVAEALDQTDPEALYFSTGNGTRDERINFLLNRLVPVLTQAESGGNPNAVSKKGALGLMQVMPDTAIDIAKKIGDQTFLALPPSKRAGYLAQPDVNVKYGTAYLGMQLDKYNGDVEAALIAYNAGPGNADKWLEASRDYAVLPKRSETEPYVEKIMGGLGSAKFASGAAVSRGTGQRIPLTTGTQAGRQPLSLKNMSPKVIDTWERVQGAFGRAVPVVSGSRDATVNAAAGGAKGSQHLHGNAIDLDVAGMSKGDRLRLLATASAMGFTGIGVYRNSIHLDMREGSRAVWGPTHHGDSVPAWAFTFASQHRGGQIAKPPAQDGQGGFTTASFTPGGAPRSGFVSPLFAEMPVTELQRWSARGVAWQQTHDDSRKQAEALAKVETGNAMEDDLAQLRLTGRSGYSGTGLETFEQQVATTQGPEKLLTWREDSLVALNIHDRSADLNQMTGEAIAQRLAGLKPAAGADFDMRKRIYEGVSAEAEMIRKAREADPATAVLEAFPDVQAAWEGVSPKDPATVKAAIQATLKAQQAIGIDPAKLAPLPAPQAGRIAQMVSNPDLPVDDRLSALVSSVLATPDAGQQAQIIRQMVKGGLPPQIANVIEAWKRDDPAATRRLFQAAMLDPEKAPKLGANDNNLGALVEEKLLGDGTIGQAFYGLDLGDPRRADVAASDLELAKSASRIAMAGGMSQDAAVDQALGDIFGKVNVADYELPSGGLVKGLVDTGVDSTALLSGFARAKEKMIDVLQGYIARSYAAVPKDADPGLRAVFEASHKNEMNRILADGIWRNNGAGWSYYDPVNRAFISDDEGRAITFTTDDLLKLGSEKAPGGIGNEKTPGASPDDFGSMLLGGTSVTAQPDPDGLDTVDPVPAPVEQPPQGRTKPPKGGYQRIDDAGSPFPEGAAAIGSGLKQQRKELFDKSGIAP